MALVKKLKDGGTPPTNANNEVGFNQFKEGVLKSLTKKSRGIVESELDKLREHYTSGTLNKAFTINPETKTYTVNDEKLKDFTGLAAGQEILTNAFGKYNITSPEQARSFIVNAVNSKLVSEAPKIVNPTLGKGIYKQAPKEIGTAILENLYGGSGESQQESFKIGWDKKSNEERMASIRQVAKQILPEYLKDYETNKGIIERDYSNVETARTLNNLLNSTKKIDNQKIIDLGNKLGWGIEKLLLSDRDQEAMNEEAALKAQQAAAKAAVASGIPEELAAKGVTPYKGTDYTKFSNYFKSKGLQVVNVNGKPFLVNASYEPANPTFISENPLSPLYGYGFENTPTGLTIYENKPGQNYSEAAKEVLKSIQQIYPNEVYDPRSQGGLGTGFLNYAPISTMFTNPNKLNIVGVRYGADILGRPNYFNPQGRIGIQMGNSVKWGRLANIKGTYSFIPQTGKPISLGTATGVNLPGGNVNIINKAAILNTNLGENIMYPTEVKGPTGAAQYVSKNYKLTGTPAIYSMLGVLQKYPQAINMLPQNVYNTILARVRELTPSKKNGGVISMQSGGYVRRYAPEPVTKRTTTAITKPIQKVDPNKVYIGKNIGVARTTDKLDRWIAGTNVGALLPGVIGSASALGATALEAVRDVKEDGLDWGDVGNLALNLGLVGASFVGLGVLRGVKAAKAIDKISDVKKLINYKGVGKEAKEIVEFAKENKLATLADVKAHAALTNKEALITGVDKIRDYSKKLPELEVWKKKLGTTAKWGSLGITGMSAVSNAPAALESLKNLRDNVDEYGWDEGVKHLTTDDVNALASVALAGKIASRAGGTALAKRAMSTKRPGTPKKFVATIKEKEIELPMEEYKKSKSFPILTGKDTKASRATDLKKKFIEKYNQENEVPLTEEEIAKIDVSPEVLGKTKGYREVTTEYTPEKPKIIQDWAKFWLETRNEYPGTSKRNWKHFLQNGGIIKGQTGFSFATGTGKTNKFLKNLGQTAKATVENLDTGTLATLASSVDAMKANERSARLQKQALEQSFITPTTISKPEITPTYTINPEAKKAADRILSTGRKYLGATSDIDRGLSAMLETTDKAGNILSKAAADAQARLEAAKTQDRETTYKVGLANREAIDRAKMTNASIRAKIPLVDVNKILADQASRKVATNAIINFAQKNKYLTGMSKIAKEMTSPEFTTLEKKVENLKAAIGQEDENLIKNANIPELTRAYEEYKSKKGTAGNIFWTPEMQKTYLGVLEGLGKQYKDWYSDISRRNSLLSMGFNVGNQTYGTNQRYYDAQGNEVVLPTYASGGSLSEKMALQREKNLGRLELENLRQYYKRLLKDEEFLQKAMIKIFK